MSDLVCLGAARTSVWSMSIRARSYPQRDQLYCLRGPDFLATLFIWPFGNTNINYCTNKNSTTWKDYKKCSYIVLKIKFNNLNLLYIQGAYGGVPTWFHMWSTKSFSCRKWVPGHGFNDAVTIVTMSSSLGPNQLAMKFPIFIVDRSSGLDSTIVRCMMT
jgi:hypothetical protein